MSELPTWPEVSLPDILGKEEEASSLLGRKFPCQLCESNFTFQERKPSNGKKSKSWSLGWFSWGSTDPQRCSVLCIKCPACGGPVILLPIGRREDDPARKPLKERAPEKPREE